MEDSFFYLKVRQHHDFAFVCSAVEAKSANYANYQTANNWNANYHEKKPWSICKRQWIALMVGTDMVRTKNLQVYYFSQELRSIANMSPGRVLKHNLFHPSLVHSSTGEILISRHIHATTNWGIRVLRAVRFQATFSFFGSRHNEEAFITPLVGTSHKEISGHSVVFCLCKM